MHYAIILTIIIFLFVKSNGLDYDIHFSGLCEREYKLNGVAQLEMHYT